MSKGKKGKRGERGGKDRPKPYKNLNKEVEAAQVEKDAEEEEAQE